MGQPRVLDLRFPTGGLLKRAGFQRLAPYGTADCVNVRPFDVIEGRERGGSRPGLGKADYNVLGSGNPIRMLAGVTVVVTDGLQYWIDNFKGNTMGDAWAAASWKAGGLPSILTTFSSVTYGVSPSGAVRTALTFDTTLPYQVDLYISPYNGAHHGTYSIFLKMNDTTPIGTTDGVVIDLTVTGATGIYTGTAKSYAAASLATYTMTGGTTGTAEAGWLSALWTPSSSNLKVYWLGTLILNQNVAGLGGSAGNRFGFGIDTTVSGGICLVDTFRIQYQTATKAQVRRRYLVASSNGSLYRDGATTGMAIQSVAASLASDRNLQSAELAQKLYIADNGNPCALGTDGVITAGVLDAASISDWTALGIDTDDHVVVVSSPTGSVEADTYKITTIHATNGLTLTATADVPTPSGDTGNCTYRVERAPKVYDPVAGTMVIMAATVGQVPTGCPLIANYRNRVVLAGAPASPHAWYAARRGSPLDWDYDPASASTDGGRAVAGDTDDEIVGEPFTALIAHSEDYLIFGCETSLWILRGDPAFGGQLGNLSRTEGVVSQGAWCRGPNGETVILSRNGLFSIPAVGAAPQALSTGLPRELLDTDISNYTTLLEYDPRARGVHIYLTPAETKGQLHYWFDWDSKTFWPVRLTGTHEPFALLYHSAPAAEDSAVMLGSRDGYIRRYRDLHERDDGTAFTSYIFYGPIRLGGSDYNDGLLTELICRAAVSSGDITWGAYVGETHEAALTATVFATGTFATAGLNYKARPRARGAALYIKLSNGETGRAWSVEALTIRIKPVGKQRLG